MRMAGERKRKERKTEKTSGDKPEKKSRFGGAGGAFRLLSTLRGGTASVSSTAVSSKPTASKGDRPSKNKSDSTRKADDKDLSKRKHGRLDKFGRKVDARIPGPQGAAVARKPRQAHLAERAQQPRAPPHDAQQRRQAGADPSSQATSTTSSKTVKDTDKVKEAVENQSTSRTHVNKRAKKKRKKRAARGAFPRAVDDSAAAVLGMAKASGVEISSDISNLLRSSFGLSADMSQVSNILSLVGHTVGSEGSSASSSSTNSSSSDSEEDRSTNEVGKSPGHADSEEADTFNTHKMITAVRSAVAIVNESLAELVDGDDDDVKELDVEDLVKPSCAVCEALVWTRAAFHNDPPKRSSASAIMKLNGSLDILGRACAKERTHAFSEAARALRTPVDLELITSYESLSATERVYQRVGALCGVDEMFFSLCFCVTQCGFAVPVQPAEFFRQGSPPRSVVEQARAALLATHCTHDDVRAYEDMIWKLAEMEKEALLANLLGLHYRESLALFCATDMLRTDFQVERYISALSTDTSLSADKDRQLPLVHPLVSQWADTFRVWASRLYGSAVPTIDIVSKIQDCGPFVEIDSEHGLWKQILSRQGIACERVQVLRKGSTSKIPSATWAKICASVERFTPICGSGLGDAKVAVEIVKRLPADLGTGTVVYVGAACPSSDVEKKVHEQLSAAFNCVLECRLPNTAVTTGTVSVWKLAKSDAKAYHRFVCSVCGARNVGALRLFTVTREHTYCSQDCVNEDFERLRSEASLRMVCLQKEPRIENELLFEKIQA